MKKKRTWPYSKVTPLSLPRPSHNIKKPINLSTLLVILFTTFVAVVQLLQFGHRARWFACCNIKNHNWLQFLRCALSFFNAHV